MNYEIREINAWSAIKVSFVINAVLGVLLGLVIGFVMLFFSALISRLTYLPAGQTDLGIFTGVASIIIFPIIYGVFGGIINGIIVTGLFCLLYNLVVKATGGVVLDLKGAEVGPRPVTTPTYQAPGTPKEPIRPSPPMEPEPPPASETKPESPDVTP
jgi:hypothetical protein